MSATFNAFAKTLQKVAEAPNRNAKIEVCVDYLSKLKRDEDIRLATRFFIEGAFASISGKHVSIGSRTYSTCAADFCEIDYEKVFKPCKKAIGSAIDAIEKLMQNIEAARDKRSPTNLSLSEIEKYYEQIAALSSRKGKQQILTEAWQRMTPVEIKYFICIMKRGSLGIGLKTDDILTALAQAFNQDRKQLRYVWLITGSIGQTAMLCKNDRLSEATFAPFHPIPFMLSTRLENHSVERFDRYIAEESFDGVRCQAHIDGLKVQLYSYDENNITAAFPEVVESFKSQNYSRLVLDGIICVVKEEKILSSKHLQKRLRSKDPSSEVFAQYPALFIACDLLFYRDTVFLNQPLEKRRVELTKIAKKYHLPVANQFKITNKKALQQLAKRAVKRGNTGLILKDMESVYTCGEQSIKWLKVKMTSGTLHAVILYAHIHPDQSDLSYSHFTVGIRVTDNERYDEAFIPIGKIKPRLTGTQKKRLRKKIKELTVERFGPTLRLTPDVVVELEFADIQLNNRTKAGYTLQLPRLRAIHWKMEADDASSLKEIKQMYEEKLHRPRARQGDDPSFSFET